jgi:3-isopropylmalate dehydrogenase
MSERRRIAVIPGDGIGPEVIHEGIRLLKSLDAVYSLGLEFDWKDWGAERWLKDKVGLPKGALEELQSQYQAIFFGALGDPRIPDMAHGREILLGMRFGLDLYANIRPCVCLHDRLSPLKNKGAKDINFVVFRENTEDLYLALGGVHKENTPDEVTQDISIHTRKGVERIIRFAFEFALKNNRRKVTVVDKNNAVRYGGSLWKRVFAEVKKEYPTIESDHLFVDVAALEMVRNPQRLDVVVTSNLFGDILTDLGAALVGGLGLAASGSVHPGKIGLFEPIHGSAPDIVGKGIANPLATFQTAAMMLEFLQLSQPAQMIWKAVAACVNEGPLTPDVGGKSTTQEVSDYVLSWIASKAKSHTREMLMPDAFL